MNLNAPKTTLFLFSLFALSAGCSDGGGGGSPSRQVRGKLTGCGVVSEGTFNLDVGPADPCILACFRNASCEEVEMLYCDGAPSDGYRQCVQACLGDPVVCDGREFAPDARCDGFPDCEDESDERDCPAREVFACDDGSMVDASARCDDYPDCEDASDEAGCEEGPRFTCDDGEKVPADWECDLERDCADGSDEARCEGKFFTCENGELLPAAFECDLEPDCEDGSDEHDGCAKLQCG